MSDLNRHGLASYLDHHGDGISHGTGDNANHENRQDLEENRESCAIRYRAVLSQCFIIINRSWFTNVTNSITVYTTHMVIGGSKSSDSVRDSFLRRFLRRRTWFYLIFYVLNALRVFRPVPPTPKKKNWLLRLLLGKITGYECQLLKKSNWRLKK